MKFFHWLLAIWGGMAFSHAQDMSLGTPFSENQPISTENAIWHQGDIPNLERALARNPSDYDTRIKLGQAYLDVDRYEDAQNCLLPALEAGELEGNTYLLLGRAYLGLNDNKKAEKTFAKGLKRFPEFVEIYLDLGQLNWARGKQEEAISTWESGLMVAPAQADLYFQLSQAFMEQEFYLWAMMYGEVFCHVEPASARKALMSKQLFEIYTKAIPLGGQHVSNIETAFVPKNQAGTTLADLLEGFPGAFNLNATTTSSLILRQVKTMGLKEVASFQKMFIRTWFGNGNANTHPNQLLSFWRKANKAGHLEAYSYWLHSGANPTAYKAWLEVNPGKEAAFLSWFEENSISPLTEPPFLSTATP